ncbi:MAG: SurA N-terminal domain-containing protein [Thermodesulfobacteriota bacterium]|nr:SurA N-terminal domain-containing protein [Thermodesulfobacteriota bacterium]
MMKKNNMGVLLIILTALFFFFGVASAEVVDRIVAVVNNDVLTLTELNKALLPYVDKINSAGYSDEKKEKLLYKIRQDMLSRMVDRKLTDQEVARLHITVSDQEIDNAIERLKQSQLMTQEDLEAALEQDGMSFKEYRGKIHQEILRPKLINYSVKSQVIITDKDVKDYYMSHIEEYTGIKKYHLYNILIIVESYALEETKTELLKSAQMIKQKLDSGENFKILAKRYSQAPNASDNGDLGLLNADCLSEKLIESVSKLAKGEYTGVIRTDQGYQLFYMEEIQNPEQKKLEHVSDEISKKLYDEIVEKKFKSWLDSLRGKANIKTML